ncbi:hypothetical protein [Paenibacillus methanolicus]|uniref:Cytoskeletal protein CcmA (Bactofilin family) n=1 Tax=Paenibacillus methanolicus TaxID=582686 RepID=A0A5S5BN89_9BACL|nr:hypothetical protein [Paenibacillus methanolicus]TYP68655.1 hypothetical protein BCM02_11852 [Paenibacillus methanolicus]
MSMKPLKEGTGFVYSPAARGRRLKIMGAGESLGGEFETVGIMGEGIVHGDLQADVFKAMGTCRVDGSADLREGRVQGDLTVEGSLRAGTFKGLGQLTVRGGVSAGRLKMQGHLETGAFCEVEEAELSGGFRIGGLLSADRLDVNLYGPCEAKEIGCGRIEVKRSRIMDLKRRFTSMGPSVLKAGLIEGDEIRLSYTEASVVRGNRVTIGPGCVIGRVEYARTLEKSRGAFVGSEVRVRS